MTSQDVATETGVGAILRVAHRATTGGAVHGHTYEVVAWFTNGDALDRQAQLEELLKPLDHTTLQPGLSTGEQIALYVLGQLRFFGCVEVEIRRPLERIYARTRG